MPKKPSELEIARKMKGYTQQEMAQLLGITTNQYSRYETKVNKPDIIRYFTIGKILGMTPHKLQQFYNEEVQENYNKLNKED